MMFKRPFQARELSSRRWFIAQPSRSSRHARGIPFGAVIALELGTLSEQIGASRSPVRRACLPSCAEASPIVCALLIAGAGGRPSALTRQSQDP